MRTFSSTVAFGRMLVIWYERAMPLREMRSGDAPVMYSPPNRICPEEGRNTPVRQLKNVLLPAPFGPIIARTSPRSTAKLTRLSAVRPPKRTARSSVDNNGAAPGSDSARMRSRAADFGSDFNSPQRHGVHRDNSVVMFSGSREMAGRRHQCLVPRDGLLDMIG